MITTASTLNISPPLSFTHNPTTTTTTILPSNFLFTPLHKTSKRQRFKTLILKPHSSSIQPLPLPLPTTINKLSSHDIFGPTRQLSHVQVLVDKVSPYLTLVLFVSTAIVSFTIGFSPLAGSRCLLVAFGAVAFEFVVVVAVCAARYRVPLVAATHLRNFFALSNHPLAFNNDHILAIAYRYRVDKQDQALNDELCDLYLSFISSVLPPPNEDLKGTEVETIIKFKDALGIDDPNAATMHMELARRIFRQRLETGDRDVDIEQGRALQKLMYVSIRVFGEASSFLLPWKHDFKVTDSQVEVAFRDNAQRLYARRLMSIDKDLDLKQLADLREAQLSSQLSDELAEEMFKNHTRKIVEECITRALDVLKSRTTSGGGTDIVLELNNIIAFNDLLLSLKNHPDASKFALGIRRISLVGGEYDSDRRIDDLKLLFRAYLTDALSRGRMEDSKLVALNRLKNIFGLANHEAECITMDVTSKVYRRLLSQVFSSGDLDAADRKVNFLQNLCDRLRFDLQKASEIHEEIYRQKLQRCLANGELSEEDVKDLLRVRVLLCVPQKAVEAAHANICGSLFEKVVKDAIASGVDGYDAAVKAYVRKAAHGLRLTREVAMSIAGKAVRRFFMNFIKQARAAGSRTESVKILKKMIAFNTLVVTELVADIEGESTDAPTEEHAKEEEKPIEDEEKWESLQTLRKSRTTKKLESTIGKPGQNVITVKDDLSERERTHLYKTYFSYFISGEVIKIPIGAQTTTKDNTEYFFLNQLGDILGLSREEIVEVHRSLAEQAFRQQAKVILADGQLTKAGLEQLDAVQKEVGLPPEYPQEGRESIINLKMAAAIETTIGQERLNIKQIRELKEAGVIVDNIAEISRENLFKKSVDEIFSSGNGDFDEEEIYRKIPDDLKINPVKAKGVVHGLARSRLANSLVQAVDLLREKNLTGVVSSLNNLLACDKAVTAEPLSWQVPEELVDLFSIYMKSDATPEKISRLQYLLRIEDCTEASLRERNDREPIANPDIGLSRN